MPSTDRLARALTAGARVAVGDGAGAPLALAAQLPEAARIVGGLRILLGWCLAPPFELPDPSFSDVRAVMGGYGLRSAIRTRGAGYVPARYGTLGGLLNGSLRPDVLLTSLVPTPGGLSFATEAGWQQAAVEAGAQVVAEVNHALPHASATAPLPESQVVVIEEVDRPPIYLPESTPGVVVAEIGSRVAEIVPDAAILSLAPGAVGEAVLAALDRSVGIHSGVVGSGVARLDARGLLASEPRAAYVVGDEDLYRWANGRPIAHGVGVTHDPAVLGSYDAFVSVSTGFELDEVGNLNAQGFDGDVIGGVGGQPDFAAAAARADRGISIVALPSTRKGTSSLVSRLSAPPTLARYEVDVVVTEHGSADLRGLTDAERRRALLALWRA